MKRYDLRAPFHLAANQVIFGILLVGYAAWSLISGLTAGPLPASMATGDPRTDQMIADLSRATHIIVYGTLIAVGILIPGLTALYYASRARHLREFRAQTEPTVLEALKAA